MQSILLDGRSLTRAQLVAVAHGARVELDPEALRAVARAADFLADQIRREEPIYGVSTGFGSNADKLLGGHPMRDTLVDSQSRGRNLHVELQRNLIVTHAVCVGEPFAGDVVRAMLCIRINTLLKGHSGIRVQTLEALAAMLNAGVVPVVPQLGSVGASGDLAPLSHLAIVLLGGGEAFLHGERLPGDEALRRAGLTPVTLSYKEGLALNNGTAQMLATGVLALQRLEDLVETADLAAAMTIDAFAGRLGAFALEVHALRPHPGLHVRHRLGLGALLAAPWPREVLHALPSVPRRQEAPAAGQLFAALHPAGARRGARCAGAGRARARRRAQRGHRQPAGVPRRAGRARGAAGRVRRPLPRHAARAGDELRQGGDSSACIDFRAPPQQAGRSRHQ
jgi:histidine ammonia-lyase